MNLQNNQDTQMTVKWTLTLEQIEKFSPLPEAEIAWHKPKGNVVKLVSSISLQIQDTWKRKKTTKVINCGK